MVREQRSPVEVRDSVEGGNTLISRLVRGMLADNYTVEQVYAVSYPQDYAAVNLVLAEMGAQSSGKRMKRRK